MNTSTDISTIKLWFERAVPNPTAKNQLTQLGVHFEEVGEMAEALGANIAGQLNDLATLYKEADPEGFNIASNENCMTQLQRRELLDALCDQIVTAVGVAHMFGMDISGALSEVNRSNWSKFVDGQPTFDANGKIKKGPNYTAPNLEPYL